MAITTRKIQPTDIIKCVRCGRAEFAGNAKDWNIVFDEGVATCFICPECQTQEDFIEAEVNAAMTDYSKAKTLNTIDELLQHFRPLWEGVTATSSGALLNENLEKFRRAWNAMNRYNIDAQIPDTQTAFSLLQEFGEIGGDE